MSWYIWGEDAEGTFETEEAAVARAWEITPAGEHRPDVLRTEVPGAALPLTGWPVEPQELTSRRTYPQTGERPEEQVRWAEVETDLRRQATERMLTFDPREIESSTFYRFGRTDMEYVASVMAHPHPVTKTDSVELEAVMAFAKGMGFKDATMISATLTDLQAQADQRHLMFDKKDIIWEMRNGLVQTQVIARVRAVSGFQHYATGGRLRVKNGEPIDTKDIWARAQEVKEKFGSGRVHVTVPRYSGKP